MIEFFIEFIVFRFGILRIVVTDNGTQFVGEDFSKTLQELKVKHIKASVTYPQANGQVEVSKRTILQGLKKRVEDAPRSWVVELPNVLWSYRTTPRSATGESPFRLAYGVEAISPAEISLASLRVDTFDQVQSLEGLKFHNDLVEEVRSEAAEKVKLQQHKIAAYFNKKVKGKLFVVNDLVLREAATSQPSVLGKLKSNWEGPYRVIKVVGKGTYQLSHLDGTPINNTWNGIHLKKFYQ